MKKFTKHPKSQLSGDLNTYQKWVDFDMKKYGKISDTTMSDIKKAGLTVIKDQYGDYEVIASTDIYADTVKKGNKWVNRGDTGEEHGEFDTKKEADAQRRAMYATGYKGKVNASTSDGYKDHVHDVVADHIYDVYAELGIDPDLKQPFEIIDQVTDLILNILSE